MRPDPDSPGLHPEPPEELPALALPLKLTAWPWFRSALAARRLARIKLRRRLRLVDLTGSGLARLRADARLCTGSTTVSRQWALALFEHPEQPDGLYYRSRHDPDRYCAAIFDRAAEEIEAVALGSFADAANARILADVLDTYGFGLIEDD